MLMTKRINRCRIFTQNGHVLWLMEQHVFSLTECIIPSRLCCVLEREGLDGDVLGIAIF